MYNNVQLTEPNCITFKILRNKDIKYRERQYTHFNVDLKRFKLEETINALLLRPEIYIRGRLPECVRENL